MNEQTSDVVVSIFSRLDNRFVRAVESAYVAVFGDDTVVHHDVYWCENGEIIPKDRSLEFEEMMEKVTKLPKSTWESELLYSTIFVKADKDIYDQPSLDATEDGTHTNCFIISDYIDTLDVEQLVKPVYHNLH